MALRFNERTGEFEEVVDIPKKKRIKPYILVVLFLLVVIAGVVSYINWDPVRLLDYSINTATISKYGEKRDLNIIVDSKSEDVCIFTSDDWITIDDEYSTSSIITFEKNESLQRNGCITIVASSKFFGHTYDRIRKRIDVTQHSGIASRIDLEKRECCFGNSETNPQYIDIITDAVTLNIYTNAEWINASNQSNDVCRISVAKNTGGRRSANVCVQSGEIKKYILVEQESGLATFFKLKDDKTTFYIGREKLNNNQCYRFDIETDGTSWKVVSSPSWIDAYADIDNKCLEIVPEPLYDKSDVRDGDVIIESNNGHRIELSFNQGFLDWSPKLK